MTHMRLAVDLGEVLFTYLKSTFMIITDHRAGPVTLIGCWSRSHYCGHNVVPIWVSLPGLYTSTISNQEMCLLLGLSFWCHHITYCISPEINFLYVALNLYCHYKLLNSHIRFYFQLVYVVPSYHLLSCIRLHQKTTQAHPMMNLLCVASTTVRLTTWQTSIWKNLQRI